MTPLIASCAGLDRRSQSRPRLSSPPLLWPAPAYSPWCRCWPRTSPTRCWPAGRRWAASRPPSQKKCSPALCAASRCACGARWLGHARSSCPACSLRWMAGTVHPPPAHPTCICLLLRSAPPQQDAVGTARDKERRKRRGGPLLLPGLCLPKALSPVLPIYLQGVLQASVLEALMQLCWRVLGAGCWGGSVASAGPRLGASVTDRLLAAAPRCRPTRCRAPRQTCGSCRPRVWASWWRSPERRRSSRLSSRCVGLFSHAVTGSVDAAALTRLRLV